VKTPSRILAAGFVLAAVLAAPVAEAAPGDAVVAGDIRVDATFEHLGVLWQVSGDLDLDSTMSLAFRRAGDTAWQPGALAVRAYPTIQAGDDALGLNTWGASAMFLEPGTSYELRLTLADPDGGGETRTVTGTTRTVPVPDPGGRQLHVVPGTGGGTGSDADPFRGLQAAADAAQPGDTFSVGAGSYRPFTIAASGTAGHPISLVGADGGSSVIDGAGTDRGVVTIGEYDHVTAHVIVDGFTIQNGRWGVDAQNTQDVVVRHNTIQDVDYGVLNRRDGGDEANQTISDNVITGRTPWPGSGIPSERGIDLRGSGNVVSHNRVRNFGDCVSVQPFTGASFGNDVVGNDAAYCVDDGIEIDSNQANVRVWRNRVTNARMGVSVQPIRGGPAYIFRNEFVNLESVPIKMHNHITGFVVAHNTGVKVGDGHGDNGAMWRNATFRNNLFLGTRYAFEFTTVADEGFRDFDYDGWGTSRTEEPGGPWFKWDDVRYDHIGDLPAGVEDHGIEVGLADLADAAYPADWDVAVAPGSEDLRLAAGSDAIGAGTPLDNLNDPFVTDGAPDLGAYEAGAALPDYGPTDGDVGSRFVDVPRGSLFFADVEWLAGDGITLGCNPPVNDRYCPDDPVTRGQMAAFLVRALDYTDDGGGDRFVDDDTSVFQADIDKLATAGVTYGCNPPTNTMFCPDDAVTRGQMAAFLVRALDYTDDGGGDRFVDDDTSVFQADIDKLATAGVTYGCNPPTNTMFCPDDAVTRGQMAAFLHRALGL